MFKDKRTAMVGTLVLALFLSSLILTNPGKALAGDAFLKIDGIDGDSTDSKHKNEIDVISWSFGDSQLPDPRTGGGASRGVVKMQDFKFTMRASKASPMLFGAVANGKHLKKVLLTVYKTGGKERQVASKISFEDVLVSSFISLGSRSADAPMEEIMLNFAKIEVSYTQFDPQTGAARGEIKSNWDLEKNKSY